MTSRNGYTRLPVVDPDTSGSTSYGTTSAPLPTRSRKKGSRTPTSLRPGLFYMFGNRGKYAGNHVSVSLADQSESEQEGERIELTDFKPRKTKHRRSRLKSPKSPKTPQSRTKMNFNVIEEPILPDDTVQRVSLRYGVPAAEIRRVNNLYRDQDFFALKTVKVPVKEHSVLTEQKVREKCRQNTVEERTATSGNNSSGAASDEHRLGGPATYYKSEDEQEEDNIEGDVDATSSGDADDEVGDSDGPEVRGVSIQSALKWKHSRRALLEKFDQDLQRIRQNTEQQMSNNIRQVAISMDLPAFHPIIRKEQTYESWFLSDWRHAIVLIVVMIIVIAIIVALVFVYQCKFKFPCPH